jgi:CRP-like cAMP-binding protein
MIEGFNSGANVVKTNRISAISLFEFLTEAEKVELIENRVEIEFAAGETIIREGFVVSNILYIDEGLVKLDVDTGKNTSTVSLISSKSFIGIICAFAGDNINFSASAIEKTKISLFDIKLFEKFIKNNGEFAIHLIRHMSVLTNEIVHHISKFSHKNIDGALSILLCDFSEIYKTDSFILPINRIEIAKILGYSKESVINTLSKFNKDGILSIHDKKIEILDKKMLKQIGEIG